MFQAAANEIKALPDVSALRPALWPSLSLDWELRWWEEPPLVCALPGLPAASASMGPAHCLVSNSTHLPPCYCCCRCKAVTSYCSLLFRTGFTYVPIWHQWLRTNGVLTAVTMLLALLSLIVLLLLGSHLYLVSLNTTTWEFMSRHRISYLKHCGADENPFDRGTFQNLWGFFCVWGTVVWEQVYFKEGSDQV